MSTTSDDRAASLLDVLRRKAADLAVREVMTTICAAGAEAPGVLAYHRCDLLHGATLVCIDESLFEPCHARVLAIHDHFVDVGTRPLSACFSSFRNLIAAFDALPLDGNENE